ncbi:MAG: hypothetical protein HY870_05160 [Chloroflexi bacterium]|nr:hypothetical protein [Chloroflexota bacterium]
MMAPYQACALYQQLAEHLRDRLSLELAELRGTTQTAEQERVNHIIRDWFFTPRQDLHGSSPRDIIRREELDDPNVLPPASPDDDEIMQELHEMDDLFGGETHWAVDDGGVSLLDEFDPEGQTEYFRKTGERFAAQRAEDAKFGEPPESDDLPFSQN